MEPAQSKREDPDWVKMAAQAHIHYQVPGMEEVVVRRQSLPTGVEFDLYSPPVSAAAPCVILIHGGPIPPNLLTTPKDWGLFQSYGRLLGASGLSAIMFDHRFFGPELVNEAMSDIRDLVQYIREHGEALNVDENRLCLWAFSGGGIFLSPFLRESHAGVRCVIAYYAALHARAEEFSPLTQLAANSGDLPPLLVARAGLDMPALNDAMDQFILQALKKNATIDVLNHAAGQHGFDARDDNERTRDILRRTVEFIRLQVAARRSPH